MRGRLVGPVMVDSAPPPSPPLPWAPVQGHRPAGRRERGAPGLQPPSQPSARVTCPSFRPQDIVAGDMSKKSLWEQKGGSKTSSTVKVRPGVGLRRGGRPQARARRVRPPCVPRASALLSFAPGLLARRAPRRGRGTSSWPLDMGSTRRCSWTRAPRPRPPVSVSPGQWPERDPLGVTWAPPGTRWTGRGRGLLVPVTGRSGAARAECPAAELDLPPPPCGIEPPPSCASALLSPLTPVSAGGAHTSLRGRGVRGVRGQGRRGEEPGDGWPWECRPGRRWAEALKGARTMVSPPVPVGVAPVSSRPLMCRRVRKLTHCRGATRFY